MYAEGHHIKQERTLALGFRGDLGQMQHIQDEIRPKNAG